MTYEIEDFSGKQFSLMADGPLVEADSPAKAVRTYLKNRGLDVKIRRSANKWAQNCAHPIFITEDGRKLLDLRHRKLWFEIIS